MREERRKRFLYIALLAAFLILVLLIPGWILQASDAQRIGRVETAVALTLPASE